MDVIVHSTPAALKINQYIYQEDKSEGTVKVTEFKTHPSNPNVHLHFDDQPNYDLGNHYQLIIKTNTHIKIEQFTPPEHSQGLHQRKGTHMCRILTMTHTVRILGFQHTYL